VANTLSSSIVAAIRSLLVASLAAEILLLPIGMLVFSRVTFAGLALNFLAIPLMSVSQMAGLAVVVFELVSRALAEGAGLVAYVAAEGLVWSANLVRFVPQLTWRVAPPAWAVVIVYYTAIGIGWALWRRRATTTGSAESQVTARARQASIVCALVAGLWMLETPSVLRAARGDGLLHVTFLDVGQGDSALVRFPRGSAMLVDAGGTAGASGFDIGDRVVAPVLRHLGSRRLDYLVLTHGDPDHIGGASPIVREFRPRQVLEGIPVPRSTPLAALQRQTEVSGAIWERIYRGWHASVDGVSVAALHPDPPDWERQRVRNEDSIVIEVRWRDVSVLLTGDIGHDTERILARELQPAALTILKVPHHGSRTSSSSLFLDVVRPDVAVFSVGRSNHFGHPAPEVLERYRSIGTTILRTDRDGAIFVSTDGYSIDLRTFGGRAFHLTTMPPRKRERTEDSHAPGTLSPVG
jgi:competence protein ComEC